MTKFLPLFLIIVIKVFSFEQLEKNIENNQHLMQKIKQNTHFCVQAYEEDKIFLKPENIIPTSKGLVLQLNSFECVQIPLLQSNIKGCFIQKFSLSKQKQESDTQGPCPACEKDTDKYGVCRNPECFLEGFRVL